MAIARDASAQATTGSGSPRTWTHVMGSGSGGTLMVIVTFINVTSLSGVSATFNGVSMSGNNGVTQSGVDVIVQYVFILYAPTVGSHTVSVSYSGTGGTVTGVSGSYTGMRSANPEVGFASGHGSGTGTGNLGTTTSFDNDWVVFFTSIKDGLTQTGGANTVGFINLDGSNMWDTNSPVTPPQSLNQSATWASTRDWVVTSFAMAPIQTFTFTKQDASTMSDVVTLGKQTSFTITETTSIVDLSHVFTIAVRFLISDILKLSDVVSLIQTWFHATKSATPSWTKGTKHSASWGKATKNIASFSKMNKSATPTWSKVNKPTTVWTKQTKS